MDFQQQPNTIEDFYRELDAKMAQSHGDDYIPHYQPSTESETIEVRQPKATKEYHTRESEPCNNCPVIVLPRAQKSTQNYVAVVRYNDKSATAHGIQLPEGDGVAYIILGLGLVVLALSFFNTPNTPTYQEVASLNFWDTQEDVKPVCKESSFTGIKRVS